MQSGTFMKSLVPYNGRLVLAIIMPFLFLFLQSSAQERLETPVKLKIEDGGFEDVTVVIKNNTTGETETVKGEPRLDLVLRLNSDYVISFNKPGYITKKIGLNTTAPADRISQGFYPFNFEVVLFKQYDGVNIVIFNQPVGKISFNRLIDDFDYDTDYTKQVQSALKAAEDEIRQKQKEAIAKAEEQKKEEARKKVEEAEKAKLAEKEKQESEKRAAEEARLEAARVAREKQAQEEQRKLEAKARAEEERQRALAIQEEEKRKQALAKMEEEERARARAAEAEEARKRNAAAQASEAPKSSRPAGSGDESRNTGNAVSGNESPVSASVSGSGEEGFNKKASLGAGDDNRNARMAGATGEDDRGVSRAVGVQGSDSKPETVSAKTTMAVQPVSDEERFEVLPDITVEEITENNRTITRVTVRKNQKETVFSKVKYNWGGIYYFRQNMSISESLFFMNTGRR